MKARACLVAVVVSATLLAALLFVRLSPLRVEVPRAAAKCAALEPVVFPRAGETIPRNSRLRSFDGEAADLHFGDAHVAYAARPLSGGLEYSIDGGLRPGAYTLVLGPKYGKEEIPFFVADRVDVTPPTWDGRVSWPIEHGWSCRPLASFFVGTDVLAHDDQTPDDAIAWEVWTSIPPAPIDYAKAPALVLPRVSGAVWIGVPGCDTTVVPLPEHGPVLVALLPVDLSGNSGPIFESALTLEDPRPSSPSNGPSRCRIVYRVALGSIGAAISAIALLATRRRSRRASSS